MATDTSESDHRHYDLSERDDWQTPEWLWQGIDERVPGGIDLDPCAGQYTSIGRGANWWIGRGEDGLERPWDLPTASPVTAFTNPAYSYKKEWVDKVVREYLAGNVSRVFLVTPADPTVQSWFHGSRGDKHGICDAVDYLWFPDGRVKFINPDADEDEDDYDSPPNGTMISMFGSMPIDLLQWMQEGEDETSNNGGLVVEGVSL